MPEWDSKISEDIVGTSNLGNKTALVEKHKTLRLVAETFKALALVHVDTKWSWPLTKSKLFF